MSTVGRVVWVLGAASPNAHRCISWQDSLPDFSECDALIINLNSLSQGVLEKVSQNLYNEVRRQIFEMLMTGEKEVFVILSSDPNHLMWLPLYPVVEQIGPTRLGQCAVEQMIADYIQNVDFCDYYIRDFELHYVYAMTNPSSIIAQTYYFTPEAREKYDLRGAVGNRIENKAGQLVGCHLRFRINYGWDWRENKPKGTFTSGRIIFLPPPTRTTPDKAITPIVDALVGTEVTEPPPPWENTLEMPGIKRLEDAIKKQERKIEEITKKIAELKKQREAVTKFRRLLWTKGPPLEAIVKEAFEALGFTEIRKIRERNLEDWVIEFKHGGGYQYGVIEVRGADGPVETEAITQCSRWVEEYLLEGKKAKGILIINQHRLEDPVQARQKRETLDLNMLEYAITRDICIIPTHEIFYTLLDKLKSEQKTTREQIEQIIAKTRGLCKLTSRQ